MFDLVIGLIFNHFSFISGNWLYFKILADIFRVGIDIVDQIRMFWSISDILILFDFKFA